MLVKIPVFCFFFLSEAGGCPLTVAENAATLQAERGSGFEILMRRSTFLLQEQNSFLQNPGGKCFPCVYASVCFFVPLYGFYYHLIQSGDLNMYI